MHICEESVIIGCGNMPTGYNVNFGNLYERMYRRMC